MKTTQLFFIGCMQPVKNNDIVFYISNKQKPTTQMANYTTFAFQSFSLPTVAVDTDFIIYEEQTQTPGDTLDDIVYTGKIVAGYALEHVDEILSQYVYAKDLNINSYHFIRDDEQIRTFWLYTTTDDWATWTTDTITIIYDWSYEWFPTDPRATKSSMPLDIMDSRQFAVQSMMSSTSSAEPVEVYIDGNTTIDSFTLDPGGTFTYFRWLQDPAIVWPTRARHIWINNIKYTIKDTCYNYCLYYLNQWGGYDYMLFAGRELMSSSLSRLSYKRKYNTQTGQDYIGEFGDKTYQTTIKDNWSLNTSWLNDTQSDKMKHLLSSNKMWLQDLTEEVDEKMMPHLIPVNITNSSCERKNWKNQDRKLYSYTIELEASQTKFRV